MVDSGVPSCPGQLNAVIDAALNLIECDNPKPAKAVLRAFSIDLANDLPNDG